LKEESPNDANDDANMRFDEENLERAIVARLSMDPQDMSDAEDDPVKVTVLSSLPANLTNLEYLVSCWKRWPAERTRLGQPSAPNEELSRRIAALDFIKRKIVEGIGLQLQEPTLFPQPNDKTSGGEELVPPLLQLNTLPTSPLLPLEQHQVISLLTDIAAVYSTATSSADLVDVLGVPLLQAVIDKLGAKQGSIQAILAQLNPASTSQDGIMDLTGMEWRSVLRAVNDLTEVKPIANMVSSAQPRRNHSLRCSCSLSICQIGSLKQLQRILSRPSRCWVRSYG
jgi:ubiquitin conjugation factor E4 B